MKLTPMYFPDVRIDVYGKGKTTIINKLLPILRQSIDGLDICVRLEHRPKGPEQIFIRVDAKTKPDAT